MKHTDTYYLNSFPISAENDLDRLQLPSAVVEIGKINFEGNVIPHEWYRRITLPSGKPDLPAIIILAEITYWYRPMESLDRNGKPIYFRRFYGHMFQSSAAYYENKFGLTKDQVRKALKRLEDGGYIRREYHDVIRNGIKSNNVMFIEPLSQKILEITHPAGGSPTSATSLPGESFSSLVGGTPSSRSNTLSPVGDTLSPVGDTLSPVGDTNTKISTKTSTTTTTAAETEPHLDNDDPSCSSSRKQEELNQEKLIFDFNLTSFSQDEKERTTKLLGGLGSEIAQQVLDEFNEALGSKCIKKSRWAWLRQVAKAAREGTFQPSADLSEHRRRRGNQAAATQPFQRKPSQLWEHCREELLRDGITSVDYHTYIAPLRGQEDDRALWLEAPNSIVAEWVKAHLPAIERTLRAHTALPVRVCIG
jgi:hypothetical protein